MTTNTMLTEDPMTTSNTDNAVRITRAAIGFGLILPVLAGSFSPSLVFGLSLAGGCLMFSSLISKQSAFGCVAALAILGSIAVLSANLAPATVAVMSLASIAIVAAGLIGFKLPVATKVLPNVEIVNSHINEISNVGKAANDDRRYAA